uniref:Metal-nicotianamine transporter YSL7 n=1 Tax=Zea mays TaxID=4577 RepID=A0A804RK28_MAIZE
MDQLRPEPAAGAHEIEKTAAPDVESEPAAAVPEPERVPPWREQVTARGMVAALLIGFVYTVIVMKLSLTTGLTPTMNVSAALLAFLALRGWTRALGRLGIACRPFTRQENTVVQTCVVACYTIGFGGGFGSFLLGLDKKTYELSGVSTPGNVPGSYREPAIGWMTGFLLAVSFVGLLTLLPLRKVLVIDYKLTYPSGTATAVLINGFHTPQGDKNAKIQVRGFLKYFGISFLWSFFQWFYTAGDHCGFAQFPTFGLQAFNQTFSFDFSLTYVGAGMICSHLVNLSLLFGAVVSWGVMWPLIGKQKGNWYPADASQNSMTGIYGYKAFLCIALLVGDGLYNFVKVIAITVKNIRERSRRKNLNRVADADTMALDDMQRDEVFNRDNIPTWLSYAGYAALSLIAVIAIPIMFREVRWYYVVVAYALAPALGFCNAYGTGLTDMNMGYNYGKDSGVVAGLVGCGLVKQLVLVSADLMHDFKTGHLTLTSPRSMLGVRRGRAGRVLEGPLRAHLPQHGHPRRGGLLGAAQALPAAVRGVLRVRGAGEPGAGPAAAPARAARAAAHGHGRAVPRGRQLRRRHVRGEPRGVRVAQARRQEGRAAGAGRRLGAHLRRRDLDVPVVSARAGQGQAAHLHEVHARELEGALTMRTEQRASFVVCGVESV